MKLDSDMKLLCPYGNEHYLHLKEVVPKGYESFELVLECEICDGWDEDTLAVHRLLFQQHKGQAVVKWVP